jgi:hypothetical protein
MLTRRNLFIGSGALVAANVIPFPVLPIRRPRNAVLAVSLSSRATYLWLAPVGHELICSSGKRLHRLEIRPIAGESIREFAIFRDETNRLRTWSNAPFNSESFVTGKYLEIVIT